MRVASIHVYPLKGARGIALERARVEREGVAHDRRFMLIDAHGHFISQREYPRLALVRTTIEGEELLIQTDAGEVRVPFAIDEGPRREVEIWGDRTLAVCVVGAPSELLSETLGAPLDLVTTPRDVVRPVDPSWGQPGDRVRFADEFPILLTSLASHADLVGRMPEPVPMDRFRPNVVVEGGAPFEEDEHAFVRIGALGFRMPKPCARCEVTTVDQATAAVGKEPLRTLASYRRRGHKVLFGQNLIPESEGEIAVGDPVVYGA